MNGKVGTKIVWALTALMLSLPVAAKKEELPDINEDGLHLIKDSKLAVVYSDPDADFTGYTEVKLLDPYISFKKNWQREQNRSRSARVSDKDMEDIKARLSKAFSEAFTEVLEKNDGFPVVDEVGDHVLILRPAIVDLDVVAPDTTRRRMGMDTYAESAGSMTLYLEVYDGPTGDLMAKALDRKFDRNTGYMTWQTSVSNSAAARRILRGWAQVLRDGLDTARDAGDAASE